MEREYNTQNWDIFDYLAAIRRKDKWIYYNIARKMGGAVGSGLVRTGIDLPEKLAEVVR